MRNTVGNTVRRVPEGAETTLRRGVEILFTLGGEEALRENGLGVTRVAELTGRDKPQVSRTLKTLIECGVVERDPETHRFRLGWRLFALAAHAADQRLLGAAPPVLAALGERFNETVHLSVLQGSEVLTVLSHTPSRVVRAASWVGRSVTSYCTSSGRALLMDHTEDELLGLFGGQALPADAGNAPSTVAQLASRIADSRARGYAAVVNETEEGLVAVAAPVRGPHGRIVAALNISGPRYRLGDRLDLFGQELRRSAAALSARLGDPISASRDWPTASPPVAGAAS